MLERRRLISSSGGTKRERINPFPPPSHPVGAGEGGSGVYRFQEISLPHPISSPFLSRTPHAPFLPACSDSSPHPHLSLSTPPIPSPLRTPSARAEKAELQHAALSREQQLRAFEDDAAALRSALRTAVASAKDGGEGEGDRGGRRDVDEERAWG